MLESTSEKTSAPKHSRAVRTVLTATAIAAGLVLVLVFAVSALMGDYKPRAIVHDTVAMSAGVRQSLAEDCKDATTQLTQRSVERARTRLPQSRYIADSKLQLTSNGEVTLEVVMNEVRWNAPWRFWVAAIPAGSTVKWRGKCDGEQQLAWRISPDSTVPSQVLPR